MESREMQKTREMVIAEVQNIIEADWLRIVRAYKNSGCKLGVSVKVDLKGNLEVVNLITELSYFPLPKTQVKTDMVTVREKQIGLPL